MLIRKIYDLIPVDGIYERDLLHKLVDHHCQKSVEDALAFLIERQFVKSAGDKIRPMFVRRASVRVVYANILPATPDTEQTLLKMHSNFEENRT